MPHEHVPSWTRDDKKRGSLGPLRGSKYKVIDCHLHVVNFEQHTPGGDALIEAMDRANVAKSVVMGLPVAKMWAEHDREAPDYYLANDSRCYYYQMTDVLVAEMVKALPSEHQDRLFPMMCGFNPSDKNCIRDVELLYSLYPGLWSGIGELLLRHDDLTAFTYGETPRANHQALWPVYEFAGKHDVPVLMHQNVTSVSKSNHPVYLYELEEALRDFPQTRFVVAHCGMSRRVDVPFYHQMVERLLDQYPQVCVDYAWIVFDAVICPNGEPAKEWIDLTEKHNDRIVLGSDMVTKFERIGREMERYDRFLDALSEETRANVCYNNAERIFGGNKNKVKLERSFRSSM